MKEHKLALLIVKACCILAKKRTASVSSPVNISNS